MQDAFLDRFWWRSMAVGDEVHLRHAMTGDDAQIRALVLVDWRAGPRGAFGDAPRTLLPVRTVDAHDMSIVLGAGEYLLTYPASDPELALLPGERVWLTEDNTVIASDLGGEPRIGDVVLIHPDDEGTLRIAGVPKLRVEPVRVRFSLSELSVGGYAARASWSL